MADEELTLTNILEMSKSTVNEMKSYCRNAYDRMEDVDRLVYDLDKLIEKEESASNKNALLQYKAALLQIKADIETEVEEMKKEQLNMNSIISSVEKAIKWNSGDIF